MLIVVTLAFVIAAVLAVSMSVRSLFSFSGTSRLRSSTPSAIDLQHDRDDELLKFKGTDGTVRNVLSTGIAVVSATANLTLTAALHAGRTVVANKADGIAFTLPAATGTGNKYRIVVGTTLTSGTLAVAVANATDYFRGSALFANDTDGSASNFETANTGTVGTESDTITFNRTTTGIGTIGDVLEFEDIGSGKFAVFVRAQASGAEATPFSAAVA